MDKPVLIIMAAGMGSRFGGLKQMTPVDDAGHFIMDYSLYDARRAGFGRVIFVIKDEIESDFRALVGRRAEGDMDVSYAFQRLDALPAGFSVPQGRVKPWGTAHAVLAARELVNGPFAVINSDDYYGAHAFSLIYDFLESADTSVHHAMVGYLVDNTLTDNGHVARGVCEVGPDGLLRGITERTRVERRDGGAAYTENGTDFTALPPETVVSMNLWGFGASVMDEAQARFAPFLRDNLDKNPLKCEYFLPLIPNALIAEGKADVKVLPTPDKWYGVTYAPDLPDVVAALAGLREKGVYPEKLWRVEE